MSVILANKTLSEIERIFQKDQGDSYKQFLKELLPQMGDAYKIKGANPYRNHLGASGIGDECARKLWMNFHWFGSETLSGRMIRLFNVGHLAEAHFLSMLKMIGVTVYNVDEFGRQYKVSFLGGHFGGSTDGVAVGVPDIPNNEPCLLEFKTASEKSFNETVKKGVLNTQPKHVVQMNTYGYGYNLNWALYIVMNKNNSDLYAEIIQLRKDIPLSYIDRAQKIIEIRQAPAALPNARQTLYACKNCQNLDYCLNEKTPSKNCRTCVNLKADIINGGWICEFKNAYLNEQEQLTACDNWDPIKV